jgi:predicted phosphohydrolase
MDVFGPRWENHLERLEVGWRAEVAAEDTVIVAGDIDWALHLEDAAETLERLHRLPGRKVLLRGNHDYWWSSKTTNKVRRALPPSLTVIHNDSVQAEGFNICGAKGSPVPGGLDWTEQDAKLLNREVQRLEVSLNSRDRALATIAALHFPPFYPAHDVSPYRVALEAADVSACVYGHLHAEAAANGPQGEWGSVRYVLVAGDAVDFRPVLIAAEGEVVATPEQSMRVAR